MPKKLSDLSLAKRVAVLRIGFGLVWAIDAAFKFEPAFYKSKSLLVFIMSKDSGEPSWLNPWFHLWYRIFAINPEFFAFVILVSEVLIAVSLIFGIARKLNYILAIPFCFLIWGVGEAFGGPYVAGTTDVNAGFIYLIAFLLLYLVDGIASPKWSLDPLITKRFSWWSKVSNPPALVTIEKADPKKKV